MNRYALSFLETKMEIDASSIGVAEEMAKNIIASSRPDRNVDYLVKNRAGESRYGSVHAKHI